VPLRIYHRPKNLRLGGAIEEIFCRLCGAENTEREKKLFGRQKSTGEIPSRRGEIIAIVTIIEMGFIGIIIIITSTIITIITSPSDAVRC
jgi:uncharacterized membrane protein YvbJ